jgi:hypothetical protein
LTPEELSSLKELEEDLKQVDGKGTKQVIKVKITIFCQNESLYKTKHKTFIGLLFGTDDCRQSIVLVDSLVEPTITYKIRKNVIVKYQRL